MPSPMVAYHCMSSNTVAGSRAMDRKALMALYAATNGLSWVHGTDWGTPVDLKYWHGVMVNRRGRVVKLFLSQNGLQGKLTTRAFSC